MKALRKVERVEGSIGLGGAFLGSDFRCKDSEQNSARDGKFEFHRCPPPRSTKRAGGAPRGCRDLIVWIEKPTVVSSRNDSKRGGGRQRSSRGKGRALSHKSSRRCTLECANHACAMPKTRLARLLPMITI